MINALINQFVYRPDAAMSPPGFTSAHLSLAYEEARLQTTDGLALSGTTSPPSLSTISKLWVFSRHRTV